MTKRPCNVLFLNFRPRQSLVQCRHIPGPLSAVHVWSAELEGQRHGFGLVAATCCSMYWYMELVHQHRLVRFRLFLGIQSNRSKGPSPNLCRRSVSETIVNTPGDQYLLEKVLRIVPSDHPSPPTRPGNAPHHAQFLSVRAQVIPDMHLSAKCVCQPPWRSNITNPGPRPRPGVYSLALVKLPGGLGLDDAGTPGPG